MSSSMDSMSMDMVPRANGGSPAFPLTTKGDLLTHNGSIQVVKPVGANDTVLTADSTKADGLAWKPISGGSPVETESNAVLGLTAIQIISDAILGEIVDFDENTIVGDTSKIIDEGNGIFRLHDARFLADTTLSASMTGSGGGTFAVFEWESSSTLGGTYTPIPHPAGRAGILNVGRENFSNQPHAIAFVDASGADVFIRLRLTPDDAGKPTSVLDLTTTGSIDSFGTSAVANSPLTTLGDLLAHNGTNDVRKEVGLDGQVLQALASSPDGLAWVNGGFEKIADETLGVAAGSFDVDFPARDFLFIILILEADTTTDLNAEFNFNGDFGPTYAFRRNENFGTVTSNTNEDRVQLDANTVDKSVNSTLLVFNKVGDASAFIQRSVGINGVSAGTLPQTQNSDGVWYNNDLITQLNVTTTIGAFSTNSRVIVFGSKT